MKSYTEKRTIVIHISINISRGKDYKTIKFGQLIEDHTKNIYLEKSYRKCGVETSPRTFFEKVKFCIFLDQNSKF